MTATVRALVEPTPEGRTQRGEVPGSRVVVDLALLRRWATVVAFAIDNPTESIDALLELAESIEEVLVTA